MFFADLQHDLAGLNLVDNDIIRLCRTCHACEQRHDHDHAKQQTYETIRLHNLFLLKLSPRTKRDTLPDGYLINRNDSTNGDKMQQLIFKNISFSKKLRNN